MAEGTARSIDPLSFHVNYIGELKHDVVKAVREGDKPLTQKLLPKDLQVVDFDVSILVRDWHASVLCIPVNLKDTRAAAQIASELSNQLEDKLNNNIETVSWKFELCYDEHTIPTYRIKADIVNVNTIGKANREYRVGRYTRSSLMGLQFAAARAAPHHYNVIMKDCVEFAKTFCYELLSYCSNGSAIEANVVKVLNKVTATGSSLETVPRRIESSGWLANLSLGGTTVASWVAGRPGGIPIIWLILYITLSQILITCLVLTLWK